MRLRLFGLLLVAAAGAGLAAWVSAASAEQPPVVKLPAPKPVAASAVLCPLPKRFRPAFESAARQTKLPQALLTAVARK